MKLVDILARELTEWPLQDHEYVVQEIDGELFFYKNLKYAKISGGGVWRSAGNDSAYPTKEILLNSADDWDKSVVSKSEWQSARAAYLASIQPARDPEIAAVVEKPANPWRRNRGRKTPPVPRGARVELKTRFGTVIHGTASAGLRWTLESSPGDIMQWRYAEPQQAQDKPMAQTIEQVIENAEAAAAEAFNPIALRDEYKRITLECEALRQTIGNLTDRMGDIEAALRAEGFALVAIDKSNR